MKGYPVENWTLRRRGGLPSMTHRMSDILCELRAAGRSETPWVDLNSVNQRTIHALEERDWIAASLDVSRASAYYITGRGLKALSVYEQPTRNFDNVCPTCCERPRGVYSTGSKKPYCDDCMKSHGRKQYALKGYQLRAETLCSRCHQRERHVYPSGKRIPYCAHCRTILRRVERRRKIKRRLWLISIGKPPKCLKCDQPIYHTPNTAYDYCYQHYREQQNEYHRAHTRSPRLRRLAAP